jgi:large subunit ribosomal protein L5
MSTADVKQSEKGRGVEARKMIEKIVVNAGVGRVGQQPGFEEKGLVQIMRDLELLVGQHPQVRKSKKSIAGFKMREGQIVGVRVTLRGQKMVDFFERLVRIVLPRVHDFRGVDLGCVDTGGALNIGFREQFVFPEVNPEDSPLTFSLGVNIVPRRKDKEAAIEAYRAMGVPLTAEVKVAKKKASKKRSK